MPDSEHLALKFAKQVYENPLILLLLGSALVSALLGSYDDAVCVVIAVTIVLTVGFVQEQRSEKSLEALNKLVPHYCNLIRNGQPVKPLANALVPGDLITFTVGDRVPADVRLISAVGLEIDESALTGETKPAKKRTEQCGYIDTPAGREGEGVSLGGRKCVAFMGTLVRSGMLISSETAAARKLIFRAWPRNSGRYRHRLGVWLNICHDAGCTCIRLSRLRLTHTDAYRSRRSERRYK